MEAFSLLNYWKNSGGVSSGGGLGFLPQSSDSTCRYSGETTTTIVTSVSVTETEDEVNANDDDEGPFFDLEFAAPAEEDDSHSHGGGEGDSDCTDGGCEFKFTLSSCSGGEDRLDPDLDFSSPSDDVYFKGQIVEEEDEVEIEPQSSSSTGTEQTCSVKAPAAQLSASILKSATKLRVLMLGMKKSKLIQVKSEKSDGNVGSGDSDKQNPLPPPSHLPESQQKSTMMVNLKVEEVPIISLFSRDNSSRNTSSSSSASSSSSTKKQNGNVSVVSDEKRFVMMQKYLKKVKPLYIKVSRRYGEKLKHSGQLTFGSARSTETPATATTTTAKTRKPGNININIPASLKVVRKHLGKSRSSSSTTTTNPPSSTAAIVTTPSESRRDDSLLQQQDSIQSAILHCKRSFNSSRDKDPSVLPRSVSDPSSYDK